jgi:hypothetical protein
MKRPIRHFERCSCNPDNGGSGMCGCVIGQMIVGYEDCNPTFQQPLLRSETCPICSKIVACSEDMYWHLKAHKDGLLNQSKG